MIAMIGAFVGFLSSAFPELLRYFKVKQDYAHEKEMYQLQVESMKTEHEFKMKEVEAEADIRESEALYKASELKLTGWQAVDGIVALYNYSVRPTITYAFMALYCLAKLGQYHFLSDTSKTWVETVWNLYNAEDMALFATIVGYWFGQRGMRYAMERAGKIGGGNAQALKPKI